MNNLKPNNFELLGKWVAPTLAWALGSRWAEGNTIKKINAQTSSNLLILDGYGFYTKKAKEDIFRELSAHINPLDKKYFNSFITESEKDFNKMIELVDDQYLQNADWQSSLKTFFRRYEEIWCPWFLAFFVGDFLEIEIKKLAKQTGLDENEVLLSITSKKKNYSTQSKIDILQIKSFVSENNLDDLLLTKDIKVIRSKNKRLAAQIEYFIKKYEWIGTHHFWGNPLTYEKFFDELVDISPKSHDKAIEKKFPMELQYLLNLAGDCAWMRLQAAETSALTAYAFRPILNKAAKSMDLNYEEMIWLTQNEITEGIKGNLTVSKNEINDRMKAYGALLTPHKNTVFTGNLLEQLLQKFIPKSQNESIKIIKGVTASKGYIKGVVKIVYIPHHIQDFNKGAILVAPETTPDYLPLMKISGAIITDKGGITSHAAIVSRELKKPCIIGTKIATQVLQDGDLIEVNANEGIIRIIEKN